MFIVFIANAYSCMHRFMHCKEISADRKRPFVCFFVWVYININRNRSDDENAALKHNE